MHKDGGDDFGILDASDYPELAAAFGANTPWKRLRFSLGRGTEALIGDRRAGDVTTEFFKLATLVGLAAGGRVQGEPRLFGEPG